MTQVYKILTARDMVKSDTWSLSVNNAGRNTRSTADLLNLRVEPARLEVRSSEDSSFPTELLKTGTESLHV